MTKDEEVSISRGILGDAAAQGVRPWGIDNQLGVPAAPGQGGMASQVAQFVEPAISAAGDWVKDKANKAAAALGLLGASAVNPMLSDTKLIDQASSFAESSGLIGKPAVSAPAAPSPSVTGGIPASASPSVSKPTNDVPIIAPTNVSKSNPYGIPSPALSGGGVTEQTPAVPAPNPLSDIDKRVSALVDELMNNPGNRNPGGGLRAPIAAQAVELLKGTQAAKYGLEGNKLTADIASDIRRQTLEEKQRYNQVLEKEFQLKLSQQANDARTKATQAFLNSALVHEKDPATGTTVPNMRLTFFNMMQSGGNIPDELKPGVEGVRREWENYWQDNLKNPKNLNNPAVKRLAMQKFAQKLVLYPQQ
jgi:hypothetical protein